MVQSNTPSGISNDTKERFHHVYQAGVKQALQQALENLQQQKNLYQTQGQKETVRVLGQIEKNLLAQNSVT